MNGSTQHVYRLLYKLRLKFYDRDRLPAVYPYTWYIHPFTLHGTAIVHI